MRGDEVVLDDIRRGVELWIEDDANALLEYDGHKKPRSDGQGRDGAVTTMNLREIAISDR